MTALLTVQCTAAPPATLPPADSPQASPIGPTPPPTPLAALPPLDDVPTYKVNPARTGSHAGFGPIVQPIEAWGTDIGCAVLEHTPALGSGVLVIGCEAAQVVAVDALTGVHLWTVELAGPATGFSPTIEGGAVFVGDTAGWMTSLDLRSGAERWRVEISPTRNPVVVEGMLYVGTTEARFLALDPSDGRLDWEWQAPEGVDAVNGTVVDETAYIGTNDGQLLAVSIESGEELWRFRTVTGQASTPAIGAEVVAVSALGDDPRGEVYGLSRSTGVELWRHASDSSFQIGPPSVVSDVVIAPSLNDGIHAFDARSGDLLWQVATGNNIGQAAAIAGDVVYLNTEETLVAVSLSDGVKLWEIELSTPVHGSPVVSGGMVFFGDDGGVVRAYAEPDLIALLPAPATATSAPQTPTDAPTPTAAALLGLVATFDAESSDLDLPSGIAYGQEGELFVVNGRSHEILVLSAETGALLRRWGGVGSGPGQFNFRRSPNDPIDNISGVAVAPDGTVYVADPVNRRVQYFTPEGDFLDQWGRFGEEEGQFIDPIDVHVGPDGTVYVVDGRRDDIQRFTPEGEYVASYCEHGTGPGQCNFTNYIFVDDDGTLYNADWNNFRIQAWDADGEWLWSIPTRGLGPGGTRQPADVAVDANGRIYVTIPGHVYVFGPDREFLRAEKFGEDEWSLAIADGHIYVTDSKSSKIYKLRPLD